MGRPNYLRSLMPWAIIAIFAAMVVWIDTGPPVEQGAYELVEGGEDFLACAFEGCTVRIRRELAIAGFALQYHLNESVFRVANHLGGDFIPAGTLVTVSGRMLCPLPPPTYLPSGAERLIPPPPFSCGHFPAEPPG